MLAAITDFFGLWQLPLFLAFVVGWVWGGGWLLHRSLARRDYPRRISLGRCSLIALVAGFTAALVGGAFFGLVQIAGNRLEVDPDWAALGVGFVVSLATVALVIYAMLDLRFLNALKAAAIPLAALVLLTAALGAAAGIPAYFIRRQAVQREFCAANMPFLVDALSRYQRRFAKPAPNLQVLADENYVSTAQLHCRGAEGRSVSYFFYPGFVKSDETDKQRLLLCDLRDNHPGGQNVLFANGRFGWYTSQDFQRLLELPENAAFAAALAQAEGQ